MTKPYECVQRHLRILSRLSQAWMLINHLNALQFQCALGYSAGGVMAKNKTPPQIDFHQVAQDVRDELVYYAKIFKEKLDWDDGKRTTYNSKLFKSTLREFVTEVLGDE